MNLYIDPGTGSMLFTILIGLLSAGIYGLRALSMKLRFTLSGGKQEKMDQDNLPIVMFADGRQYWNVFEPICQALDARGQEAVYMTAAPDDPGLKAEFQHVKCEFIGEGNRAFTKLNLLKADVLLSSTPGLDVYQWKRSKDVKWYAHVPHACSDITCYRMFGLDYYDQVFLSGEYQADQIRQLEALRNLPAKQLDIVGVPYMDRMKKRLESAGKAPDHPLTVLVAPSWGPNSILNRYGADFLDRLLKTGYHVIVRPHPQSFVSETELMEKLQKQYPDGEQLEWNRDPDNFEVLHRSDIMISDFSGVIFDFALVFDKPVICADTSFDTAIYDAHWLEEPMWTFQVLPKISSRLNKDNMDDLKTLIDESLRSSDFREGREQARKETWAHVGESAGRIADSLIEKLQQLHASQETPKAEASEKN